MVQTFESVQHSQGHTTSVREERGCYKLERGRRTCCGSLMLDKIGREQKDVI